jgi:hypothetical protein
MKKLSKVVALPEKVGDGAKPEKVRTYARDLHDSLEFTLKDIIRRANAALPRDGTEEMEDDLTLANNTPTVDEHAASKKYVDDLIATAGLESGARIFFDQDAAPTGWTRDTGINDRVIRIVSGARAHGGSWTISGLTGASTNTTAGGTVAGVSLSIAQLAAHTHPLVLKSTGSFSISGFGTKATPGSTGGAGSGSSHTHGFTGIGHNHPISVSHTPGWRPLHRDVIVASKD